MLRGTFGAPLTERKHLENAARADGLNGHGTPEAHELENTGERFLPGVGNAAEMSYDHIARYRLVERYVEGRAMIDMGCGAGYGSNSLSRLARSVQGVDLSEEAIGHARRRYHAQNLSYQVGDVTRLPFEDSSFEVAISFEVIEHLDRPEDLVVEAKRVVRDDGLFLVSTPDKQTYSNDRNSVNPYHVKEMYEAEFREILERHFEHVTLYRQGAFAGSLILAGEGLPPDGGVALESAHFSLEDPEFSLEAPVTLYIIAVCTNGEPPEPLAKPHMILDRDRQIFEETFDWGITAHQIKQYHNYKHHELAARVQETNRKLRRANEELKRCRHDLDVIRNSGSYALALKIRDGVATARGIAARVRTRVRGRGR